MASDWLAFAKVLNKFGIDVLIQRLPGNIYLVLC
jgi:hypothetical protein